MKDISGLIEIRVSYLSISTEKGLARIQNIWNCKNKLSRFDSLNEISSILEISVDDCEKKNQKFT